MVETREIYEEEEVGLLDLLLVVAENLRLLVIGPLLAGLVALVVSYALPQSFISQSILSLPTSTQTPVQAISVMVSPLVLDPVIHSLKLAEGETMQIARLSLARQISATVGKDGLVRLDVTAHSPTAAQSISNAVIDTWLKTTIPPARDRADLEARLAYAKVALAATRALLERLALETSSDLNKSLSRGEAGMSMVAIGELQARYFSDVLNIPRTLHGLSRDVVVQPPTLPTEPSAPKKGLIAVLATLACGITLLIGVFIRNAWKKASQDSLGAEKQAKLRGTLGIKRLPRES